MRDVKSLLDTFLLFEIVHKPLKKKKNVNTFVSRFGNIILFIFSVRPIVDF